jgi:hypothetical protein
VGLDQFIAHPIGLHHGQLAAAGGDAQGVGHQGQITATQIKGRRNQGAMGPRCLPQPYLLNSDR